MNTYEREMKRALRVMHGLSNFELTVNIDQDEHDFLAAYAKLSAEHVNDEVKLAAALKDLLRMVISLKPKAEKSE